MVPRSGRHADEWDSLLHRDLSHERLRPVAARHADDVGRLRSLARDCAEIVTTLQEDGLDVAPPGLGDEVELLHFAAAGLGIHDQNGPAWSSARLVRQPRGGWAKRSAAGEREQRGRGREHDHVVGEAESDQRDCVGEERDGSGGDRECTGRATPRETDPRCGAGDHEERERKAHCEEVSIEEHHERRQHSGRGDDRHPRGRSGPVTVARAHGSHLARGMPADIVSNG